MPVARQLEAAGGRVGGEGVEAAVAGIAGGQGAVEELVAHAGRTRPRCRDGRRRARAWDTARGSAHGRRPASRRAACPRRPAASRRSRSRRSRSPAAPRRTPGAAPGSLPPCTTPKSSGRGAPAPAFALRHLPLELLLAARRPSAMVRSTESRCCSAADHPHGCSRPGRSRCRRRRRSAAARSSPASAGTCGRRPPAGS